MKVETQLAGALTISVRTFDKSPLPSGGRVFVSLRLGWHPPRLDLPNNRSGQADVVLPAVAKEQLQISVRVPGFKVLRTLPRIQWDMNHSYPLRFEGATTLIIVLTPDN